MTKFNVRKPPFMFPVVVVLGLILWKWANGSDSSVDPNLECVKGKKMNLLAFLDVHKPGYLTAQ